MHLPLIIVCLKELQVPSLLIALVKLLQISKVDALHVVETLFSYLVYGEPRLDILDQIIHICFLKWLNILLDLGLILLLCDSTASNRSGNPFSSRLMQINVYLVFN